MICGALFAVIVSSFESVAPTLARTRVSRVVVSTVRASPFASVVTLGIASVPAVVVKLTRTFGTRLLPSSMTNALSVTVPPRDAETDDGFAVRMMRDHRRGANDDLERSRCVPPENARRRRSRTTRRAAA